MIYALLSQNFVVKIYEIYARYYRLGSTLRKLFRFFWMYAAGFDQGIVLMHCKILESFKGTKKGIE